MTLTQILLGVLFILRKKTNLNDKRGHLYLEIHCGGGPYLTNSEKQLRKKQVEYNIDRVIGEEEDEKG